MKAHLVTNSDVNTRATFAADQDLGGVTPDSAMDTGSRPAGLQSQSVAGEADQRTRRPARGREHHGSG